MNSESKNIFTLMRGISISITLIFAMSLFSLSAFAQVAKPTNSFNHMQTGFPLTGAHAKVECETCHTGGLFKGTPKDCAGCHSIGRRVVAPAKKANHMPTTAACETCHTNVVTFQGARFNHIGVQPKACVTCHNGLTAPGKPNGHRPTTSSCDSCHRTSVWLPAGYDHAPPIPACETCHTPGGPARAKPVDHVFTPVGVSCDTCHKSGFSTFLGATFDHIGANILANTCQNCHVSGKSGAKTRPSGHIPSASVSCDVCHSATGYANFSAPIPIMNHDAVAAASIQCSTCHNGGYTSQKGLQVNTGALGKTPNHVATGTAECGTCHLGRISFLGASYTHQTGTAVLGKCDTCHKTGGPGLSKPLTHISTTLQCDSAGCHTPTNYLSFAGIAYNHTGGAPGNCGTCHLGQSAAAKQKSLLHIPTNGNACDACHGTPSGNGPSGGFVLPAPTRAMIHAASVPAIDCILCHNGSYTNALPKKPGHVATNAACNVCHLDTSYISFAGGKVNHASITTLAICGTCHKTGGGATAKPATGHIPVTGDACDACHSYSAGTFATYTMNHANVTTTACSTCHKGAYAKVISLPPVHIPYPANLDCGSCHLNKIAFTNSTMNHGLVTATTCATCHSPTYKSVGVLNKTLDHMTTTDDCKVCHLNTNSFLGAIFPHTGVGAGTCGTCHIPGTSGALKLPATGHIPVTASGNACDSCHTFGYAVGAFASAKMNHAVVSNICNDCHNGSYTSQKGTLAKGAVAKPAGTGHIPTTITGTLDCNTCHTSTSSWTSEKMNHNGAQGLTGVTCFTCHLNTASYPGNMQKKSLTHDSNGHSDCSDSGCHKPRGTVGTSWVKWK
jgi:hypothetical protein